MKTLAERFSTRKPRKVEIVHPATILQLQKKVRAAHRFVFDDYATVEVANVIKAMPELLVREQQWARPPYDLCWIELNLAAYWDTFHGRMDMTSWLMYAKQLYPDKAFATAKDAQDYVQRTGDYLVGFLIDHNRINSVFGGTREHPEFGCEVAPIQYRMHTEWPEEDQARICTLAGMPRQMMDQFLWGSSYTDIAEEAQTLLRRTNAVELTPFDDNQFRKPSPASCLQFFRGGVGEFRIAIALMLMLNRPTVTRFTDVPPTRGPKRFQPGATNISYTSVQVDLNAVHVMRKIGTPAGESVPRRRHEVREHYVHDQTAHEYQRDAGCLHSWRACGENNWTPLLEPPPLSYQVLHWVCEDCGGKRWFRHEHERGDESRGRVIHQGYEVTSKKKEEDKK